MLRPANKGEVLQSAQFLQLIEEAIPGTYNANGVRHVLTCLKGEIQPEEAWDSFRPDGVHEDAWAALSKEHVLYTAQIRWDYAQQFVLARLLFGVGSNVHAASSGAGYLEEQFALTVHDARPLQTYTLEYGSPKFCSRHTYGVLVSINRNSDRDAQSVDGQLVIMARRAQDEEVSMTGGTPQNTVLAITANNVTTDGVFAITADGAATENVTLHVGDSTATVKAALEALNSLTTVTVVGTVATASGELHILTANNATSTATIYDTIVVTPGVSAASLQAAIRALGGVYANVTVTEALVATATGSSDVAADYNTTTSPNLFGAGATGENLSPTATTTVDLGESNTLNKYRIQPLYEGAGPYSWVFQTSPDNVTWTTRDTQANQNGASWSPGGVFSGQTSPGIVREFTLSAPIAARYIRWVWNGASNQGGGHPSGDDPILYLLKLQALASTYSYTGPYSIQFPSGAGNVADIASAPGTNWVGAATQPGNAGGSMTITISNPANQKVDIRFVSGAGWSGYVSQMGNDGRIKIPTRTPVLPQHFGLRSANSRAELATAALCAKVKKATLAVDNLVEGVFFAAEGNTTFQSHSDSDERSITLTILVAITSPLAAQLKADARLTPSHAKWYEIRDVSGNVVNSDKWQVYASVAQAKPFSAAGKVRAIEATLKCVLDDYPFTDNLISDGGASLYFITRRAA